MRIPRRISELVRKKQDFIDRNRARMERSVIKLQSDLLDQVLTQIITELDVKDGIIQGTVKNYRILGDFDTIYKAFIQSSSLLMGNQIIGAVSGIASLGAEYYEIMMKINVPADFKKIVDIVSKKINLRVGIDGDRMVRSGFLDSFLKDNTLGTQIKNFIAKEITAEVPTKEFIRGLSEIVTGKQSGPGGLERQYQRFAFDLYQQYDAAYSSTLGQEYGLRFVLYQGGLIEDSRDFCAAHNGKVWTMDEVDKWETWTPSEGEYPEGYEVKSKNPYEIPSYLGYPGYQPLIDRGGYNCRHTAGFITDDLAFELRPELKDTDS